MFDWSFVRSPCGSDRCLCGVVVVIVVIVVSIGRVVLQSLQFILQAGTDGKRSLCHDEQLPPCSGFGVGLEVISGSLLVTGVARQIQREGLQ